MSRAKPEPAAVPRAFRQQRAVRQRSSNQPGVAGLARPTASDAKPLPWVAAASPVQGPAFRQSASVARRGAQLRIRLIRARARQLAIITRGVHSPVRTQAPQAAPVPEPVAMPAAADDRRMNSALAAGAVGHLFTEANESDLAFLMRSIEQGDSSAASQIARRILGTIAAPARPQAPAIAAPRIEDAASQQSEQPESRGPMSPREHKVLQLIARGWSNQQIADETHRSINTIEAQLKSIYRKLAVKSRTQAVRVAVQEGFLNWDGTAPV